LRSKNVITATWQNTQTQQAP